MCILCSKLTVCLPLAYLSNINKWLRLTFPIKYEARPELFQSFLFPFFHPEQSKEAPHERKKWEPSYHRFCFQFSAFRTSGLSAQSRSGRTEVFRESSGEDVERAEVFGQLGLVVSGSISGSNSGLTLHDELGQSLAESVVSLL